MKLTDKLEEELMQQCGDAIINGLPYTETFRAFDKVVGTCFGVFLQPGYKGAIETFRNSYKACKCYISMLGVGGGLKEMLILLMWLGGVGGLEAKCLCCLCKGAKFLFT